MIYFGPPNEIDQNRSNRDEIMILQQHCGGENLPVFKGFVRAQGKVKLPPSFAY